MRTPKTKFSNKGMTLIEMLTVIVIIAVLMGMLFPIVGGVKNSAKRAQASVECNGLVSAFKMYENEYGVFPSGVVTNTSAEVVTMLSGTDAVGYENPKRIRFFDFQQARITNGMYVNPLYKSGSPNSYVYQIQLDTNYVGYVGVNTNGLPSTTTTNYNVTNSVAVWITTNSAANISQYPRSWK